MDVPKFTQIESRLKKDKVDTERKAIADIGGTMPEDLPTPQKSLKQLEKENKIKLKKSDKM